MLVITLNPANGVHTAVCLSGQARHFELTAPTIAIHFLSYLSHHNINTHVYISTYHDQDTQKLRILHQILEYLNIENVKIVGVAVLRNETVPLVEAYSEEFLASLPGNIPSQVAISMFTLTENCNHMIIRGERKFLAGEKYSTIVRLRPDLLFHSPPAFLPYLPTHVQNYFWTPGECQYGGLNDRFAIGARNTMLLLNARLGCTQKLAERRLLSRNSETHLLRSTIVLGIASRSLQCNPFFVYGTLPRRHTPTASHNFTQKAWKVLQHPFVRINFEKNRRQGHAADNIGSSRVRYSTYYLTKYYDKSVRHCQTPFCLLKSTVEGGGPGVPLGIFNSLFHLPTIGGYKCAPCERYRIVEILCILSELVPVLIKCNLSRHTCGGKWEEGWKNHFINQISPLVQSIVHAFDHERNANNRRKDVEMCVYEWKALRKAARTIWRAPSIREICKLLEEENTFKRTPYY